MRYRVEFQDRHDRRITYAYHVHGKTSQEVLDKASKAFMKDHPEGGRCNAVWPDPAPKGRPKVANGKDDGRGTEGSPSVPHQ